MTFDEACWKLYMETVGSASSPFCTGGRCMEDEVPCCKLQSMSVTYIMFVDKAGAICLWSWDRGDPVRITEADMPQQAREADSWRIDTWYTGGSHYNVSDWYKEDGWPVN